MKLTTVLFAIRFRKRDRAAVIAKYLPQYTVSNRPGTKKTLNFHSEELLIVLL